MMRLHHDRRIPGMPGRPAKEEIPPPQTQMSHDDEKSVETTVLVMTSPVTAIAAGAKRPTTRMMNTTRLADPETLVDEIAMDINRKATSRTSEAQGTTTTATEGTGIEHGMIVTGEIAHAMTAHAMAAAMIDTTTCSETQTEIAETGTETAATAMTAAEVEGKR